MKQPFTKGTTLREKHFQIWFFSHYGWWTLKKKSHKNLNFMILIKIWQIKTNLNILNISTKWEDASWLSLRGRDQGWYFLS